MKREIPIETLVALGQVIPDCWSRVMYGLVKPEHQIWCLQIRGYREPYTGEIGQRIRNFLCVVRKN